jgi:hypothetical protein
MFWACSSQFYIEIATGLVQSKEKVCLYGLQNSAGVAVLPKEIIIAD